MSNRKTQTSKQHQHSSESSGSADTGSKLKKHVNNLFEAIDKELDVLITENAYLKERVNLLEEILVHSGANVQPEAGKNLQQKLSHNLGKRDSMVTASQLSQKIKSTYKLKTSAKIFKGPNTSSSHLVGTFEDFHKDGLWYITSSQKMGKNYVATASADGTVLVCEVSKTDFPQLVPHTSYHGHQSSVNCVKFHPTNDLMLTASGDGTAHIWKNNLEAEAEGNINVDDGINQLKTPQLELKGHAGVVISATWLAGLEQCVTASWDHMGNIYDYNTGEMVVQLVGHDQELTDVCAHESSRLIVTSSNDTTFRLWDFRDAIHSVSVFQGHNRAVTSTSFLGNDKIVSGGDDRNVKVWDLRNMRSPLVTISMESTINKLSVCQQHNLITIPLDNRNVRIYDINGTRICRLSRDSHSRMVTCATWLNQSFDLPSNPSGSNSSLPSGSGANSGGNNPTTSGGIGNTVTTNTGSGNINPNSLTLFTCAFDRRVCIWNVIYDK